MATTDIQCVVDAKALLGEGTCWDADAQCLWWLDIHAKSIQCYVPKTGETQIFKTPQRPGCLAVRQRGGLVLAMGDGFHFFDPPNGSFQPIIAVESEAPEIRMNDGKTDRQGRFWSGGVFEAEGQAPRAIASLHCLRVDLSCNKVAEGITCSNGLAWSPDSRTLYLTDSATPYIWAWDFDPATAEIDRRRVFIDLSSQEAIGDGATVDADGCYWLTLPFKGMVQRYDPDGKLMRTIELPVDIPTCCEFGGEALDTLYVTTATLGRSSLANQPWAGGLLAIDVGTRGLAAIPFVG